MRSFIALLIFCSVALSASTGEISKRGHSRHYEWQSTDCYKPNPPMVFDLDSYTRMQIDDYLKDVETFRRCLQSEADSDFDEAKRRLADGIEEGLAQANSEIEADLRSLEMSVMLAE